MEMAIVAEPLVEQVMVIGEGRPVLGAVMVVDEEEWKKLAASFELDPQDPASTEHTGLKKAVLKKIATRLKDFPGYAKIRVLHIEREPWTVEEGLMTPTLKKKRPKLLVKYKETIDALYEASSV